MLCSKRNSSRASMGTYIGTAWSGSISASPVKLNIHKALSRQTDFWTHAAPWTPGPPPSPPSGLSARPLLSKVPWHLPSHPTCLRFLRSRVTVQHTRASCVFPLSAISSRMVALWGWVCLPRSLLYSEPRAVPGTGWTPRTYLVNTGMNEGTGQ